MPPITPWGFILSIFLSNDVHLAVPFTPRARFQPSHSIGSAHLFLYHN